MPGLFLCTTVKHCVPEEGKERTKTSGHSGLNHLDVSKNCKAMIKYDSFILSETFMTHTLCITTSTMYNMFLNLDLDKAKLFNAANY